MFLRTSVAYIKENSSEVRSLAFVNKPEFLSYKKVPFYNVAYLKTESESTLLNVALNSVKINTFEKVTFLDNFHYYYNY